MRPAFVSRDADGGPPGRLPGRAAALPASLPRLAVGSSRQLPAGRLLVRQVQRRWCTSHADSLVRRP